MGKLYQTALLPAEKDQVTRKLLNWKARFFSACGEEPRFDPIKAAAYASPDRKAANRASTSSPPIRTLSAILFFLFFLYMVIPSPS